MTLDAFAVVVAFLAFVELALGVAAIVAGIREARAPPSAEAEARRPLLVLIGATLLVVALVSCPLLYLLVKSWVPRWPGVMCVEGVRRIGTDSRGAPGWLPGLVAALDYTKPAAVFVAGAWAVLRRVGGGASVRRAALAAVVLGLVATLDGAVETAYVSIPKEETPADSGCCMIPTGADRDEGLTADGGGAEQSPRRLTAAFLAAATVLGVGAGVSSRLRADARRRTTLLAALAAGSLPLAVRFLVDVVAPTVLRLPYHHCMWCAFAQAPETIVGASAYFLATCCAGWACVARWATVAGDESAGTAAGLLRAASFGYLATAAMSAVIVWRG